MLKFKEDEKFNRRRTGRSALGVDKLIFRELNFQSEAEIGKKAVFQRSRGAFAFFYEYYSQQLLNYRKQPDQLERQ